MEQSGETPLNTAVALFGFECPMPDRGKKVLVALRHRAALDLGDDDGPVP